MGHLSWFRLAIHLEEKTIPMAFGALSTFSGVTHTQPTPDILFPQQIFDAVIISGHVRLFLSQFPSNVLIISRT